MNPTTQTYPRTSRPSGTEYAAAIERQRREDHDGVVIAAVLCMLCGLYVLWAVLA